MISKSLVFDAQQLMETRLPVLGKAYKVFGKKVMLPDWFSHVVYCGIPGSGRTAQMGLVAAQLAAKGYQVNFASTKPNVGDALVCSGVAVGNTGYASIEEVKVFVEQTWHVLQERKKKEVCGAPTALFVTDIHSWWSRAGEQDEHLRRIVDMLEDIIVAGAQFNVYLHIGTSVLTAHSPLYKYLSPDNATDSITHIFIPPLGRTLEWLDLEITTKLPPVPDNKIFRLGLLWHGGKGTVYRAGWLGENPDETLKTIRKHLP